MKTRALVYGLVGLVILLFLGCLGVPFLAEIPLTLAFGWVAFLYRVVPRVSVSVSGLATLFVCLAGVSVGTHALLNWLAREMRAPGALAWRAKWSAQVVAVVVLMFVAGIGAAGVVHQAGWLLTMPEPWLRGDSQVIRRVMSVNNLKQIGLAVDNYRQAGSVFPPGASMDERGTLLHSWQTLCLPYLEQQTLYDRIDRVLPWDDLANAAALRESVPAFLISGVRESHDGGGRGLSHYEGNARVVGRARGLRAEDVRDGTSNTILAGESDGPYRAWGEPGHWRDPADGINAAPGRGLGGPFPGGANVLFLDGSVRFLKNSVNPAVLKALSTPDGGEQVSADAY